MHSSALGGPEKIYNEPERCIRFSFGVHILDLECSIYEPVDLYVLEKLFQLEKPWVLVFIIQKVGIEVLDFQLLLNCLCF